MDPCPDCGGSRGTFFAHKCPDPQGNLFANATAAPGNPPLPPHVAGSDTSLAAAESMRRRAQTDRNRVLAWIYVSLGATADEVQIALGLTHQNGSARVSELAKAGLIEDTGKVRPTRSGRDAVVYVVTESGGMEASYLKITPSDYRRCGATKDGATCKLPRGHTGVHCSIPELLEQYGPPIGRETPDEPSAQDLLVFVKLITVLLDARTEPPTGVRRVMLWLEHLAGDA